MMEALSSSETSILTRATRRNVPEDTILQSYTDSYKGISWERFPCAVRQCLLKCVMCFGVLIVFFSSATSSIVRIAVETLLVYGLRYCADMLRAMNWRWNCPTQKSVTILYIKLARFGDACAAYFSDVVWLCSWGQHILIFSAVISDVT
jgi:hypothetical protein